MVAVLFICLLVRTNSKTYRYTYEKKTIKN